MAWWLQRGTFELVEGRLVMPNFIEAQEASASNAQRCREKREKARDRARAEQPTDTKRVAPDPKRVTDDPKRVGCDTTTASADPPSRAVPNLLPIPPLASLGDPVPLGRPELAKPPTVAEPAPDGGSREEGSTEPEKATSGHRDGHDYETGATRPAQGDIVRPGRDGLEWLVPAWLEGMRTATGEEAVWTTGAQSAGPRKELAIVLEHKAPAEPVDRCAWARQIAREYVDANQGASFGIFQFKTWLGSGKPARGAKPPETPYAEPAVVKEARKEREDMMAKARAEAVPMPPETKAALRAIGLTSLAPLPVTSPRRPPSTPTSFDGTKVQREELPLEERRGVETAADFDGGTPKAEAR
jgi:hypothetical protein